MRACCRNALAQNRVVAAFVLAAQNHQHVAGKRSSALSVASTLVAFESLKYSTPRNRGDEFDPVLDSREGAHALGDRGRLDSRQRRGRRSGQNIFDVVLAAQADVAARAAEPISVPSRGKQFGRRAESSRWPRASAG